MSPRAPSPCANSVLGGNATTGDAETGEIWVVVISSLLLFCLVFGMAGTVDFEAFRKKFQNAKGILIGVGCQFLVLPLIGFITVKMLNGYFATETLLAQMLIIVVSSPGGSYSNWWCNLINADLALSVAMTTVSTFLAMAFLPLNVFLYATLALGDESSSFELPWADLGRSLGIVIVGIMLGLWTGKTFPEHQTKINLFGNLSGLGLIIFGLIFSSSGATGLFEKPLPMYVASGLPVILGITLAATLAWLARLPSPERVAVAIETCYQNTGIAVAIAISFTQNPAIGETCAKEAAAIPALYGMAEILIIGIFAIVSWQLGMTYSPRTDNIFKVLFGDYQHLSPDAVAKDPDADGAPAAKAGDGDVNWDAVAPKA